MKRTRLPSRAAAFALPLALWLAAGSAQAEVTLQAPSGFTVTQRRATEATPAQLVDALAHVGAWWGDKHTYSQHASNLQLDAQAGGCFCERWAAGSVEHAHVVYANRETGVVRLVGALGPLQPLAVNGVLSFSLEKVDGPTTGASGNKEAAKRQLVVTYRVGGADAATLAHWPAGVDHMIGETADQLARYLSAPR